MQLRIVAAVAAAGAIGAAGRWALAAGLDDNWALLIVNIVGCGIVGWATARHERARAHGRARLTPVSSGGRDAGLSVGLTVGFCGALTSMSAFALQLAIYLDDGRVATAGVWLGMTIAACTAAFVMSRFAVLAYTRRP